MQNARIEEFSAHHLEAEPPVKSDGMRLRAEFYRGVAALAGGRNQFGKQHAADAAAAPRRQYRHATYMTVGQQPSRTDCFAGRRLSEHMQAFPVDVVPFEFFGNVLLPDKHCKADSAQLVMRVTPSDAADPNLWRAIHGHEL